MSILIDENTKVVVQGITGRDGSFHTKKMKEYGTKIVAGVTPGKGGMEVEGIPVFDTVEESVKKFSPDVSIIFVPARFAVDAAYESIDNGINLIVIISEGIPVKDMTKLVQYARLKETRVIGPNCPGLISPGKSKIGILPGSIFRKGKIGVVSRSGTLTYEVVSHLTKIGLGESTCVGIGGDPVKHINFIQVLKMFEKDPDTKGIAMIGEIGGTDEQDVAKFIKEKMTKPVVAFIAGKTAPPGKRMGHAGAIITGSEGTAEEKIKILSEYGIYVASEPEEIARILIEKI